MFRRLLKLTGLAREDHDVPGQATTREVEPLRQSTVRFVREQDGEPERQLKTRLLPVLRSRPDAASAAFLVCVDYGEPNASGVALCAAGPADAGFVRDIGVVFSGLFSKGSHLDILFLSDDKESEVRKVCEPFYERESA